MLWFTGKWMEESGVRKHVQTSRIVWVSNPGCETQHLRWSTNHCSHQYYIKFLHHLSSDNQRKHKFNNSVFNLVFHLSTWGITTSSSSHLFGKWMRSTFSALSWSRKEELQTGNRSTPAVVKHWLQEPRRPLPPSWSLRHEPVMWSDPHIHRHFLHPLPHHTDSSPSPPGHTDPYPSRARTHTWVNLSHT